MWQDDHPPLTCDEVHVWPVVLDLPESWVSALYRTLSPDEVNRAARFHFPQHKQAYVVGRGLLRAILAGYLDAEPGDLRFVYGRHGKPALAASDGIQFNLSHSHDHALIAVTRDRPLGIDLEWVRPLLHLDQLAATILTPDERAAVSTLAPADALAAFFRAWTRKEAILKARGDGLALPLSQIEVSWLPGETNRWTLCDLGTDIIGAPGYTAALAAEGDGWRVSGVTGHAVDMVYASVNRI